MLLGNYSVFNKSPGRSFSGSVAAGSRAEQGKSGAVQGRFMAFSQISSTPNATRPPYSSLLAVKPGSIGSKKREFGAATGAVNLAGGKSFVAESIGDSGGSVVGQLVASIIATCTGTSGGSVAAVGPILGVASSTGTSDGTVTMGAIAHLQVSAAGTSGGSVTLTATGKIVASSLPYSDLSPEGLAAAVWSSPEGSLLYAIAHCRVVTDPVAGTYTVYDTDDVTVLYQADLWSDADGTTPYSGAGAERRDRLV